MLNQLCQRLTLFLQQLISREISEGDFPRERDFCMSRWNILHVVDSMMLWDTSDNNLSLSVIIAKSLTQTIAPWDYNVAAAAVVATITFSLNAEPIPIMWSRLIIQILEQSYNTRHPHRRVTSEYKGHFSFLRTFYSIH